MVICGGKLIQKDSMSITNSSVNLDNALAKIPSTFRKRIINSYLEMKKRYGEALYDSSFDAAGLSSGKFVESVFRFLQQHLTGTSIAFGKHIPNFADEARKLIQLPNTSGIESLRVIIPRALVFMYTLRGKRGIGHVGGDVEANEIDSATIIRLADWIICELIRVFHNLSLEDAQSFLDAISTRSLPLIWEVGGKKRILRTDLAYSQQVLLLTYTDLHNGVLVEDLYQWTEYKGAIRLFKTNVLSKLHSERLIEFDKGSGIVFLSPLGVQRVEISILANSINN